MAASSQLPRRSRRASSGVRRRRRGRPARGARRRRPKLTPAEKRDPRLPSAPRFPPPATRRARAAGFRTAPASTRGGMRTVGEDRHRKDCPAHGCFVLALMCRSGQCAEEVAVLNINGDSIGSPPCLTPLTGCSEHLEKSQLTALRSVPYFAGFPEHRNKICGRNLSPSKNFESIYYTLPSSSS